MCCSTKVGFILSLPLVLPLASLLILLSHNILSNVIFIIVSIVIVTKHHEPATNSGNAFLFVNMMFILRNIVHIMVLFWFRYPFDKVRVIYNVVTTVSIIILSISLNTSHYVIPLSILSLISEFWIKSSKQSIIKCEDHLLRLLYYDNYHSTYERDTFKEIDDNIVLERKFCNGISYFDVHLKQEMIQERPTLVIIHGYYSGKIFAAPAIRVLSRHYDLIIPDLPGNGLSDRLSWFSWILSCKLCNKSNREIEEFFVDILDDFVEEVAPNNFYLIAHSFGAYLTSLYVIRHGDKVGDKLILLSPVGLSTVNKPSNLDEYVNSNKSMLGLYMKYGWGRYGSMQELTRCLGPCCGIKLVRWRLAPMQHTYFWTDIDTQHKDQIYKYWEEYTYHMYLSAPTSLFERLFYDFMGPYIHANEDISPRFMSSIAKHGIDTLICHGDTDWVSTSNAEHICDQIKTMSQNDVDVSVNVDVKVIENCSHQVLMNQSVMISKLMRQFIETGNV